MYRHIRLHCSTVTGVNITVHNQGLDSQSYCNFNEVCSISPSYWLIFKTMDLWRIIVDFVDSTAIICDDGRSICLCGSQKEATLPKNDPPWNVGGNVSIISRLLRTPARMLG